MERLVGLSKGTLGKLTFGPYKHTLSLRDRPTVVLIRILTTFRGALVTTA